MMKDSLKKSLERRLDKGRKQGFTLVELLVVIAIIAVLATVSVVGYLGFTKKAKVSNDISLTTQMNTALKADAVTEGNPTTPTKALDVLKENGFIVANLTPTADGYQYVWDSKENQMLLLDDKDSIVCPENVSFRTEGYTDYFKLISKDSEKNEKGFSYYLKDGYEGSNEFTTGVDVGNNQIDVNYSQSEKAQDVIIRTNGGTLTVDAEKDTVRHYGEADKVNITAVANQSYHEYGSVKGNIEIAKGRVEVAKEADVAGILVTGEDVKVDFKDKNCKTNLLVSDSIDSSKLPTVTGKEFKAEESKASLVKNIKINYIPVGYTQQQSTSELAYRLYEGKNVILDEDIILSNTVNLREYSGKGTIPNPLFKPVSIDLNGHTITYTSSTGAAFKLTDNAQLTIKGNGKIKATIRSHS